MINLSNRGFPMLQAFANEGPNYYMTLEEAQAFDQRPFRSMLIRRYITYNSRRGFHITREGRDAFATFMKTDITRKDPTMPLTAYFDATAYGIPISKRRLRVVHHNKSAAA